MFARDDKKQAGTLKAAEAEKTFFQRLFFIRKK
jgi:hypothetical protein